MTEDLANTIAAELPRARRRMWILLAVTLAIMAAMLVGALLLMHSISNSQP